MKYKSGSIRWGILGTGFIAQKFADALLTTPDSELVAVGSRNLESAQKFAQRFQAQKAYGSYEDLVQDSTVDVVYISTPNVRHKQDCLLCLNAKKAILCEKPFTMNAEEAREIINLARERNLFCMEGMWIRFMPLIQKVKEIIASGEIGEITLLTADFGYPTEFDPQNRFFNPDLGGGALLDRGVYNLSLAFFLLNYPSTIHSEGSINVTGVDEQSAIIMKYDNNALAILHSTLMTYGHNTATITGKLGKLIIHEPFYQPEHISISKFPKTPLVKSTNSYLTSSSLKQRLISLVKNNIFLKGLISQLKTPTTNIYHNNYDNAFFYEIAEVNKCLKQGCLESTIMPLDETLKIMEIMDEVRKKWSLIH